MSSTPLAQAVQSTFAPGGPLAQAAEGFVARDGQTQLAQAVAAHAGYKARLRGEPVRVGFLLGTRRYSCAVPAFAAGSTLDIHVRCALQGETGLGAFDCRIVDAERGAELATATALDFLAHFGLIEPAPRGVSAAPQRRFELLQTCMVHTPDFKFARPLIGFETFAEGELIATDGDAGEIRAPCDDCTVLMPAREPIVGREAVYLTRPIRD